MTSSRTGLDSSTIHSKRQIKNDGKYFWVGFCPTFWDNSWNKTVKGTDLRTRVIFNNLEIIRVSVKKALYDREGDSNNGYNGRFWTGWSEWYGCPSFKEIELNPFGPNAFDRKY